MSAVLPTNTLKTNIKPKSSHTSHSDRKNFAWIVLIVGFLATFSTTLYIKSNVDLIIEEEFVAKCEEIKRTISERLDDHARILSSGVALFDVLDTVSREEWYEFTQHQHLENQLPGIQGIGFSLLIPREKLAKHIRDIRDKGFSHYTLYPEGDRKIYTSIIYLEPFSDRNLRAFGYDMFTESVRQAAMEQARDTHDAALSGKVILVQETEERIQSGTLMYVPVYRKGAPTRTIEQRRAAVYGWVFSPYRMNDLIEGVLGVDYLAREKQLSLQVFDGKRPLSQSLLYTSANDKHIDKITSSRQVPIEFNGHYWTLIFKLTGDGVGTVKYLGMWLVMGGGTLIVLLLFALINVLSKARIEALNLAEERAEELRASEKNFKAMVETLPVAIYASDRMNQVCEYVNPSFVKLFGYSIEEVSTVEYWLLLAYPDESYRKKVSEEWTKRVASAIEEQLTIKQIETEVTCKNGSKKYISWGYIAVGEKNYAFGIDLTERKKTENELSKTKEYYRLLTEISPSGIWMTNASGDNTYVSPKWSEITGIIEKEARGSGWSEHIHLDDKEKVFKGWLELVSGDSKYQSEFRFVHPNGNIVWVLCLASPLKDKENVTGWVGSITDITDRKMAEETITKVNMELEERVQSRTAELQEKSHNLEEVNAALKVLLRESITVKEEIEAKILANIKDSVLPYLDEIAMDTNKINHELYIQTIKANINTITSSFNQSLSVNYQDLTPREIQIAGFIRQGKTNKEIGILLNVTQSAVDFHRRNIREKFNIKGKKENLRVHLLKFVG